MESIAVERVNPDGDTRDRRTIEEIQQVLTIEVITFLIEFVYSILEFKRDFFHTISLF